MGHPAHFARREDPSMRDAQVEPRSRGRRSAKTDRLDARWLARLLAKLPQSWIPPAQIQELRDRTRLRKALAGNRRGWGPRLHALPAARGLALLEIEPAQATGAALGGRTPAP